MLLKLFFSFIFLTTAVFGAKDIGILSSIKKSMIKNEQMQNKKSSDILKYDWINPINATYTHTKSNITSPDQTSDVFSISLNQPIFKSGGIYYAIKYAKANRKFLEFVTSLKNKSLIVDAYTTVLELKNLDLNIKKQKLLIDNAKIDIKIKKEQYLSGIIDSTFLDDAILKKNSLDISLLDMLSSKADLLRNFKTLSSSDYKKVKLPHLKLLKLKTFLSHNLSIKEQIYNKQQLYYLKKMRISSYLPTISLFASYSDSRTNYIGIDHDSYKQYGISISMPIFDINRKKNIELQELKYIESKLNLQDQKRAEKELYDSIIKKVKIYQEKIKLSNQQEKLYASLLKTTQDLYKGGEKTIYDVKTMENSLKSTMYDKYIYKNDIDILLLKLFEHFKSDLS